MFGCVKHLHFNVFEMYNRLLISDAENSRKRKKFLIKEIKLHIAIYSKMLLMQIRGMIDDIKIHNQ